MKLELYTNSRDGLLYTAKAIYEDGKLTVLAGSQINTNPGVAFKPSSSIASIRSDRTKVDEKGVLLENIIFTSLSTAATFVTGRTANGMIVWKTMDGKYARYSLKKEM